MGLGILRVTHVLMSGILYDRDSSSGTFVLRWAGDRAGSSSGDRMACLKAKERHYMTTIELIVCDKSCITNAALALRLLIASRQQSRGFGSSLVETSPLTKDRLS